MWLAFSILFVGAGFEAYLNFGTRPAVIPLWIWAIWLRGRNTVGRFGGAITIPEA